MKKIRLIIFDLDGTLIDAYEAITRSFNFTMERFGYARQSRAVIRKAVGWGDKQLLKPFVKAKDLSCALKIYRRHHKKSLIDHSRIFPKARRLLAGFKSGGYKLAVASNRPTRFSLLLLRHLGLRPYFDYVLCADKLKAGKPDPQILRLIMARFRVSPGESVYVGDMVIDAQAGRRAGVRTVIVTTGSSSLQEIRSQKPWKIIGSIGLLRKLIPIQDSLDSESHLI